MADELKLTEQEAKAILKYIEINDLLRTSEY